MGSGHRLSSLFDSLVFCFRLIPSRCKVYYCLNYIRKRGFGIFNLTESKAGTILRIPDIIFVVIVVGICIGIYFAGVSIDNLI